MRFPIKSLKTLPLFFILYSLFFATACSKSDDTPQPATLAVTYNNVSGDWQLVEFNSHKLPEGTYLRMSLSRRDHAFTLTDNLNSMYGQTRTGTFTLTEDEDTETTILSGHYDNGVGEWNHEYTVTRLTASELHLLSTDSLHESQVFQRIQE
ncbi:MAG: lipocalin family protein [Bacteroidaceae bacterium]|nr:lipocalin family protein [Bacteroidaceae bacterium]